MTLAASGSSGGLGLLIVAVFIVAAIVIFVAMSRSMRRMRSNVDRGDFGTPRKGGSGRDGSGRNGGRTPPAS